MKKEKTLSKKDFNVHKVWHSFTKKFSPNTDFGYPCNDSGYSLMQKVEKWAKKYPNDVRIVHCDDGCYAGSLLVLIEHRSPDLYHGTTVIYIPQCTGEKAIIFFLYPDMTVNLIKALKSIRSEARPIEKREREWRKQK